MTADRNAGALVAEVHPSLAGLPALAAGASRPRPPRPGSTVTWPSWPCPPGSPDRGPASCLTASRSSTWAPDFRLADPAAWSGHYPGQHAGYWPCGLPELPGARPLIQAADRVALPGCYATAAILALAPLLAAGLIAGTDIVIVAASGTSGPAGRCGPTCSAARSWDRSPPTRRRLAPAYA